MIQALTAAADLDPIAIAKVVALALTISLVLAFLQNVLRNVIWSVFNFIAAVCAFPCRALLTFEHFLSARTSEAVGGLSEEGQYSADQARPWVGWFIVGPTVYCVLMLVFMASDLTVAILIFEAMGLTIGAGSRSPLSFIPLENAMGVVFVALAVFWGIVLFDLWALTPFSYIWSGLNANQRRRLVMFVLTCLTITILTGLTMGVWSQAQLKGGLPEPWQTVLPWIIRGDLVALLICATAVAGKPFGSAVTALWVVILLVVRVLTFFVLMVLRFVLVLIRALIHVPLTILALLAFLGHKLWNWVAGFGWARRMRLGQLASAPIVASELGGEAEKPLSFEIDRGPSTPSALLDTADNKARMRRVYEDVFPSDDADLEEFFAPGVVHRDLSGGGVAGLAPLKSLLQEMRAAFSGLQITVDDQIAEGNQVVSRLTLTGIQLGEFQGAPGFNKPVRLHRTDSAILRDGKVVERWGLFDASAHGSDARTEAGLVAGDGQRR